MSSPPEPPRDTGYYWPHVGIVVAIGLSLYGAFSGNEHWIAASVNIGTISAAVLGLRARNGK